MYYIKTETFGCSYAGKMSRSYSNICCNSLDENGSTVSAGDGIICYSCQSSDYY